MEKLRFNVGRNKWIVEKSSDSTYPDQIHKYHPWLELFQAGDSFYLIVAFESNIISFCSEGTQKLLGYEADEIDMELLLGSIHPDDAPVMEEFEAEARAFYRSLPAQERMQYKVQYNLRMKTKSGKYKHLMFQSQPRENAADQERERLLVFTDITAIKSNSDQFLSLVHVNGGPSKRLYLKKKKIEFLPDLSEREVEILRAVMQKGDLPETAERLHISLVTLRNHLFRIREKVGAKTTVHLVAMAKEKNWLKQ
ncbi:MAG TPA: LuxR C-terminal-related transcriptional regulator [Cryomorphaceae bacterium]|nr:LuxR C-terminal-related transcriptional regulator [Cryomorphaceae bacterium]